MVDSAFGMGYDLVYLYGHLMIVLGQLQSGTGKETGNPSWKRPLPHILVAALSSFLYGYHLGLFLASQIQFSSSLLVFSFLRSEKSGYISSSSFLFLFRVVNDTLETIGMELGFSGSTLAEGAFSDGAIILMICLCNIFV